MASSNGKLMKEKNGTQMKEKKKAAVFQYWGKVYKYKDEQHRKEFVAVSGDIPCVGHGISKAAAIEEVRGKVEFMVQEYQKHLKCPPIPSPPQRMDELLQETEDDVQEDGGEILEQELFCIEIKI